MMVLALLGSWDAGALNEVERLYPTDRYSMLDRCGISVAAHTYFDRPGKPNDVIGHDVEWRRDGYWDEDNTFVSYPIDDDELQRFLNDWTHELRQHIPDYVKGDYRHDEFESSPKGGNHQTVSR